MSIVRGLCVLAIAGHGLFGCATNPATGVAATGQPLDIKIERENVAYRERQKVGEVQYLDASGASAGSANVYQTRVVNGVKLHWWPTQGGQVIDEQDFFRIARDDRAVAEVDNFRSNAKWLNRAGFVLFTLGAGGIAYAEHGNNAETSPGRYIGGASVLGAITGALWIYYGYFRTRSDYHVEEIERFRESADRYNVTLKAAAAAALKPSPPASTLLSQP